MVVVVVTTLSSTLGPLAPHHNTSHGAVHRVAFVSAMWRQKISIWCALYHVLCLLHVVMLVSWCWCYCWWCVILRCVEVSPPNHPLLIIAYDDVLSESLVGPLSFWWHDNYDRDPTFPLAEVVVRMVDGSGGIISGGILEHPYTVTTTKLGQILAIMVHCCWVEMMAWCHG